MMAPFDASLLDDLTSMMSQAAAAILSACRGPLDPRRKPDLSPVTAADEAAEAIILDGVARLLPGIPVISEEATDRANLQTIRGEFILVDPLDGTLELLAGRDEFTINLALVRAGFPILGIVAAPALGLIWRTAAGSGAERLRVAPGASIDAGVESVAIRTRSLPKAGIVATVSRSHFDPATETFLAQISNVTRIISGSAIKFCRVAEGAADIYPRLAPTYQWDVAAGHAVLAAAGGSVTTPERLPLSYRPKTDGLLIPAFIAWGDLRPLSPLGVEPPTSGRKRQLDSRPFPVSGCDGSAGVGCECGFVFW